VDTAPATPRARSARVGCLAVIVLHALMEMAAVELGSPAKRANRERPDYFRSSSLKAAVASAQRMSSISRERLSALAFSSSIFQLSGCWLSS